MDMSKYNAAMSPAYWARWNDDVQTKIDRDIEAHRKANGRFCVDGVPAGAEVVKYGVRIGIATRDIRRGGWVHLHVMRSAYDERSSHLDAVTGAPRDIRYD